MRHAFMLLGIMTFVIFVGALIAFERAEAPEERTDTSSTYTSMALTLSSPVFNDDERIPSIFTCDGENKNPELRMEGIPEGTASLVLLMDDPDIPDSVKKSRGIEKFDHWVLYNIPPETRMIPENGVVGEEGLTSLGAKEYVGPCPPDGEHRYLFRLYALKDTLTFDHVPTLDEVEERAREHMLASVTLVGRYERVR